VSKALRDHPDISKETRDEIRRVAQKLGYTPNLIARKLSSNTTRSIGLVVPHIAHPFFSESIEAIYDEAHRRAYDIIMMITGENAALEAQHIQTLLSLQVDGFLISVSEKTENTTAFQVILERGKKIVFFDRVIESLKCSCVVCDDYQGTFNLVSFAINNGYTRIGYIAGYKEIYIGRERRRGFEAAMKQHHIPIHPEWVIEGGFGQRDGYEGFMSLYRRGPLPQLIVTVTYASALGVLQAIKELGLKIPQDIDLIAFGDSVFNQFLKPSLTVSRLDARKMGRCALELLIEAIHSKEQAYKKVVIPTRLVVNETGLKPVR
ncbi:MAG: LacI family transcriptional regulator, partial [candidate division KSB1 bacterium]|nr:LacI family transcriptional regulator [candidate division KSB1 bacterium]